MTVLLRHPRATTKRSGEEEDQNEDQDGQKKREPGASLINVGGSSPSEHDCDDVVVFLTGRSSSGQVPCSPLHISNVLLFKTHS